MKKYEECLKYVLSIVIKPEDIPDFWMFYKGLDDIIRNYKDQIKEFSDEGDIETHLLIDTFHDEINLHISYRVSEESEAEKQKIMDFLNQFEISRILMYTEDYFIC